MGYERLQEQLDNLWQLPVYDLPQSEKEQLLLPFLNELTAHHQQCCEVYGHIYPENADANNITDLPYLAVRLFKHLSLSSIDQTRVFKTLQSSGTSGQQPARVFLDKHTSGHQSKALVKILQQFIGPKRLPMLIIDSPSVLKNKALFSARGAGIQGLSFFGRDHTYALNEQMQPDWQAIDAFCNKYQGQPVLVFGFTFMVWLYFIQQLKQQNMALKLSGYLLHSGGWKKLEADKVDNNQFKSQVFETTGIEQVINFYGMAEQVGSVFVECSQGHLHTPLFADVIFRDPYSLEALPAGQQGLIQVLSVLPWSYPGHSLLTEDMGQLLGTDDCPCGRKGRYFSVNSRLPKMEVRGCSDTHQS